MGKAETEFCLECLPCSAEGIVSRYILPFYRRRNQNNETCICCSALILIIQDVCCLLHVQIIILWLLVCVRGNTVYWVLRDLRVLPLLTARLCDSQPVHSIVPVPWHLGGGMMQRQPWRWSQLWCNAVMQQQGYFRSTSEPPRPPSASMLPCPSLSQHLICHEPDSHTWTGIHRIY